MDLRLTIHLQYAYLIQTLSIMASNIKSLYRVEHFACNAVKWCYFLNFHCFFTNGKAKSNSQQHHEYVTTLIIRNSQARKDSVSRKKPVRQCEPHNYLISSVCLCHRHIITYMPMVYAVIFALYQHIYPNEVVCSKLNWSNWKRQFSSSPSVAVKRTQFWVCTFHFRSVLGNLWTDELTTNTTVFKVWCPDLGIPIAQST